MDDADADADGGHSIRVRSSPPGLDNWEYNPMFHTLAPSHDKYLIIRMKLETTRCAICQCALSVLSENLIGTSNATILTTSDLTSDGNENCYICKPQNGPQPFSAPHSQATILRRGSTLQATVTISTDDGEGPPPCIISFIIFAKDTGASSA